MKRAKRRRTRAGRTGRRVTNRAVEAPRAAAAGELHRISDPRQLPALIEKLGPALRQPRIFHLYLADPHRLLGAIGVELAGEARERFDASLKQDGFEARPEEYERVLTQTAPVAPNLMLPAAPAASSTAPAAGGLPLDPLIATRVDSLATLQPSARWRPEIRAVPPPPPPPQADLPASHEAPVDYSGTTGGWDVVVQLHENFFRQLYDIFFAFQPFGAALDEVLGSDTFVDYRYTFESWLFIFLRADLAFNFGDCHFRMKEGDDDTMGVEMRVTVNTFSKLLPDQDWGETDEYTGTIIRWGSIAKRSHMSLTGQELDRVYVADFANGWSEIYLDQGPNSGRTDLLEPALDAYFAAELPELPVTMPVQRVDELNVSWPNSAGFSRWRSPDLSAVSLCFDEAPDSRTPFHDYILHHGRNVAIGVNAPLIEQAIVEELPDLPIKEGIATIDDLDVNLRPGVIEVKASGFVQLVFKLPIEYYAEITLRMEDGVLTGELSDSSLQLPWYLWFLTGIFTGLVGIVLVAIGKGIGKGDADDMTEDNLDFEDLFDDLFSAELGGTSVEVDLDSVGVGAPGVFIRGNVTPLTIDS